MKKTVFLLLLSFCFVNAFGQGNKNFEKRIEKVRFVETFNYKNHTFMDIDSSNDNQERVVNMKDSTETMRFMKSIFANSVQSNRLSYTVDSIPETSSINVNGVLFSNKNILTKLSNHKIFKIKKDSIYTFDYKENKDSSKGGRRAEYINVRVKYQRPNAKVYQEHPYLPHDFFIFKLNTLEPIRYHCSSFSPVLDVFNTEDTIGLQLKPRIMIDGRLKSKAFDYQNIDLKNIEKIEVFGSEDAIKYFGQKVKSGLISIITKGSKFNLDWILSNTHVIGEMQDKKGNWKIISDTLLTNIQQFNNYRTKCLQNNGAIYKIDGEFETEFVNRQTVDMDGISNIRIAVGMKTKDIPFFSYSQGLSIRSESKVVASDTVFIEIKRAKWDASASSNFGKIMSELQRLRKTTPDLEPLYIVDNQEIDSEKLKQYKPKELEFVESLEGCDAISKYGKRAEYGVAIYRKKKIE